MKTGGKLALIAGTATVLLVLSGCAGGSEPASTGSSSTDRTEAQQAALDTAFTGVAQDLADLPPVEVTPGINLFVVSCGEAVPGCAVPAAATKEAAEAVGWDATIADGKLNADGFATAIRQAIAADADVIVPVGMACTSARAAFKEAVDAGILIVGGGGVDDCDPKLWAGERLWLPDYTPVQQWNEFGKQQADYAYGVTGDVKALVLVFSSQAFGPWIADGFEQELAALDGGEVIEKIEIGDSEVMDGSFVQKVTTSLLSHPEVNTLASANDSWLTSGLSAAIVQAGLDERLTVIGRAGEASTLDLIRTGNSGIDATVGFATPWGAWGSVDTAIRILAGQDSQYIGESIQTVDKDHNLPESGPFVGTGDYAAQFKKAWGVD
jgi:ribose transport system substrate-binding protein